MTTQEAQELGGKLVTVTCILGKFLACIVGQDLAPLTAGQITGQLLMKGTEKATVSFADKDDNTIVYEVILSDIQGIAKFKP